MRGEPRRVAAQLMKHVLNDGRGRRARTSNGTQRQAYQITSSSYSGGNDNSTDDNEGDADNGDDNGNGGGRTSNLNRPSHIISNYHKPNQMHITSR